MTELLHVHGWKHKATRLAGERLIAVKPIFPRPAASHRCSESPTYSNPKGWVKTTCPQPDSSSALVHGRQLYAVRHGTVGGTAGATVHRCTVWSTAEKPRLYRNDLPVDHGGGFGLDTDSRRSATERPSFEAISSWKLD